MLDDAGCRYVILGHSERRADHGESDDVVRAKVEAAHGAGLAVIVCVGETLAEREAGATLAIITRQLAGSLPAGLRRGRSCHRLRAGLGDRHRPHADLAPGRRGACPYPRRRWPPASPNRPAVRILYGGSVKPDNAEALMAVRQYRRRAGRRREPGGGGFLGHRARLRRVALAFAGRTRKSHRHDHGRSRPPSASRGVAHRRRAAAEERRRRARHGRGRHVRLHDRAHHRQSADADDGHRGGAVLPTSIALAMLAANQRAPHSIIETPAQGAPPSLPSLPTLPGSPSTTPAVPPPAGSAPAPGAPTAHVPAAPAPAAPAEPSAPLAK